MNSNTLMPQCVVEDMGNVFAIGALRYRLYKETRFVSGKMDVINTTISKNLMKFPKDADKYCVENPVKVLSSTMLINACVHRTKLATKLFQFDLTGNFTRFK